MSKILAQLRCVAEDLQELRAPWALVGGLAVSVYCEPRTTRDIDVAVALSKKELEESIISSLKKRGYGSEQILMQMNPTHQMGVRLSVRGDYDDKLPVDFLIASSGIEPEIVSASIPIQVFPNLLLPVACPGHLIAMKLLSQNNEDRIRDRLDLRELLLRASSEDALTAKRAVELIMKRGFSCGKNLSEEYDRAVHDYAPHLT